MTILCVHLLAYKTYNDRHIYTHATLFKLVFLAGKCTDYSGSASIVNNNAKNVNYLGFS